MLKTEYDSIEKNSKYSFVKHLNLKKIFLTYSGGRPITTEVKADFLFILALVDSDTGGYNDDFGV